MTRTIDDQPAFWRTFWTIKVDDFESRIGRVETAIREAKKRWETLPVSFVAPFCQITWEMRQTVIEEKDLWLATLATYRPAMERIDKSDPVQPTMTVIEEFLDEWDRQEHLIQITVNPWHEYDEEVTKILGRPIPCCAPPPLPKGA